MRRAKIALWVVMFACLSLRVVAQKDKPQTPPAQNPIDDNRMEKAHESLFAPQAAPGADASRCLGVLPRGDRIYATVCRSQDPSEQLRSQRNQAPVRGKMRCGTSDLAEQLPQAEVMQKAVPAPLSSASRS